VALNASLAGRQTEKKAQTEPSPERTDERAAKKRSGASERRR